MTCAGREWDAFYVVATDPLDRVKFGISSGDARTRLRTHRSKRGGNYCAVIRLLTGLPEGAAIAMERAVSAALLLAQVKPIRGREHFDKDALALILDIADNYAIG